MTVYAQETYNEKNLHNEDFGITEGITVYGQRPIDEYVLDKINGSPSERRQFSENYLKALHNLSDSLK